MKTFGNRRNFNVQMSSRGSVLIVVLWVSLGLLALTITFGHSMMMAYRGADNDFAGHQADEAVEAGLNYAETVLTNTTNTPGLFPDVTTYQSEAVPVGDASFWLIGRDNTTPATATPVFGLIDEASKINLNAKTTTSTMLQLLPITEMTPDIADAIIEWRSATAASSFSYGSDQYPYEEKGAAYESVEELSLIYGMDNGCLYAEDANLNGALDPNEDDGDKTLPSDNSNGTLDPGLAEFLTVYSKEPNTQTNADGTTKTDVSKITSTALATFLQTNTFDASRIPLITSALTAYLQAKTPPTLTSLLEFQLASGMTTDEFTKISGSITLGTTPYIYGLVNVNTASADVLACLPGMNQNLATQIVSAQLNNAGDSTGTWVSQYLTGPAVQAAGYLTGKSYQITADVAAVGRNGRGYRRTRFVIDMSSGAPVIIYRRSLSHLGWSLGADTRTTLATRNGGL